MTLIMFIINEFNILRDTLINLRTEARTQTLLFKLKMVKSGSMIADSSVSSCELFNPYKPLTIHRKFDFLYCFIGLNTRHNKNSN